MHDEPGGRRFLGLRVQTTALLSILLAVAGTMVFLLLSRGLAPSTPTPITQITPELAGRMVLVKGTANAIRERDGSYFLSVCSTGGCARATVFSQVARVMKAKAVDLDRIEGRPVAVTGVVEEDQGSVSINVLSSTGIEAA